MTDAAIIERLDSLTAAVHLMAQLAGARLTRAQLADRLRVHRNSMGKIINRPDFPKPAPDGKWLLSEIIEWESRR